METFAQNYSQDFSHISLHGLQHSKTRGGSPGFLETCATLKLKLEAETRSWNQKRFHGRPGRLCLLPQRQTFSACYHNF